MDNLTTALTQKLTTVFDNFSEGKLPQGMESNTVAMYEVVPSDARCKNLFFYIRKNELDIVTDIELVGSNAELDGEVAVDLIYPYQFRNADDLEAKIRELSKSIFNLLGQQVDESKQMSLFDNMTEYSVN